MIEEIFLGILQGVTEFLPVSSSGHLAIVTNIISEPNLFLFTALHISTLLAVLIFTRKEIYKLMKFDNSSKKLFSYLIIATIPGALFGYFFNEAIEKVFSSVIFLSGAFFFTGFVLLMTRFPKEFSKLDMKNAFIIGIFQILALFPGVSRSGMTISSGMILGIRREEAAKFSFLLLIPLAIGAFILEFKNAYFTIDLLIACLVCLITSLIFLSLLMKIIRKGNFWVFSLYCFGMGLLSLILYFI